MLSFGQVHTGRGSAKGALKSVVSDNRSQAQSQRMAWLAFQAR